MIKGGKGGSKTLSGLKFEEKSDMRLAFAKIDGYSIKNGEVHYGEEIVANLYKKYDFYKIFLASKEIDYTKIISKKLLPDEAIYVPAKKTVFIVELKFQEVSGSVDEKLQTCDFKRKQYVKLLEKTGLKVEYVYVLNPWFKDPTYKDVLEYIQSVKCHYFFEELPLNFLGLPHKN